MGSGLNNHVYALAVLPDGDVLVGGIFTTAGGAPANQIARYNPTTEAWSAVGDGLSGAVGPFTVLPNGDVIAAGAAGYISRLNPTTGVWSTLGSGVNGSVYAVAVLPDGDLIVGGEFTTAGGLSANRIARFNPATETWSALGLGTDSPVSSIAVVGGDQVVVLGAFNLAGGVQARNAARYNLNTGVWSGINASNSVGSPGKVVALSDGDVVVGGGWSTIGGVSIRGIARYNLTTGLWTPVGTGVSGLVHTLQVLANGDLLMGGNFSVVGRNAWNVARYTFGGVTPSIALQPVAQTPFASGSAMFSVVAGGTAPFTYRWHKDSIILSAATNPSAATDTLVLVGVSGVDEGAYHCVVSNACGSAESDAAELTICPADINSSGSLTVQDVFDFLGAYFAGEQAGDFNGNGMRDLQDVYDFVAAYFAGCSR